MSDLTEPMPGSADDGDRPLEPLLQALAEDYHRPPAAPREAMWAAIRAARDADRLAGAPAAADAEVVALPPVALVTTAEAGRPPRRGRAAAGRRWAGPLAALAATLLLGVGLGRWTARPDGPSGASVDAAAGPGAIAGAGGAAGGTAAGGTAASDARLGAPPQSNDRAAADAPRNPDDAGRGGIAPALADGRGAPPRSQDAPAPARERNPDAADRRVGTPARLAAADPADAPRAAAPADAEARVAGTYRVATVQHLGQVEALLTAFRAESGAGAATVAATDAWARELLTSTRLLLDSPASADPQLGPLLGDLEAVLVQIVHLPAARAAGERQLIAQSLDQSQLMTHLRAAVPSGPAAPQRSGE